MPKIMSVKNVTLNAVKKVIMTNTWPLENIKMSQKDIKRI